MVLKELILVAITHCKFGSMKVIHENMNIIQIVFHTLRMKHIFIPTKLYKVRTSYEG